MNYQACRIKNAVYSVYADIGDEQYAKRKTDIFLKRCGINSMEQFVNIKNIKEIVYAMLDKNSEEIFWNRLNS